MIRMILAMAVAAAALALTPRATEAREAPWCAVGLVGPGVLSEDCSYWTLEACVPYVIAGNRGFCNPNPRYSGPPVKARRKHYSRRR